MANLSDYHQTKIIEKQWDMQTQTLKASLFKTVVPEFAIHTHLNVIQKNQGRYNHHMGSWNLEIEQNANEW